MKSVQLSDNFLIFWEYLKKDIGFKRLQYYMLSLKKSPHGGIFENTHQSMFFKYYPIKINPFINRTKKIPYPIKLYTKELEVIINNHHVKSEELLKFCFCKRNGDGMYAALVSGTLSLIEEQKYNFENMIFKAVECQISFLDYFNYNYSRLLEVFLLFALNDMERLFENISDIINIEILEPNRDKYGLSDISNANFERQGFSVDGRFYLYNIFFDTSIGNANSFVPQTIEIFKKIPNLSIFMRKDRNLSVLSKNKVCYASNDLQKWRGKTLLLDNFEQQIINQKEVVVHFSPETMHKVLVIVKPERIKNSEFCYNIVVEALWSPKSLCDSEKIVLTNFIHGCYFPKNNSFDHIDFSINQYSKKIFEDKYRDCVENTSVSIEKHSEEHYKVWCIKSNMLSLKIWSELVFYTLDEPFRNIFSEIIGGKVIE